MLVLIGKKRSATGLQGFHQRHLLFELDEASDVEDPNWDAAESSLRLDDNKILAAANPIHTVGRMWQIFNLAKYKKYWYGRQVSYLESSLVDKNLAEMQIDLYGKNSDIVQVRWFGKFPGKETSDILPSFQAVTQAVDRGRNQDIEALQHLVDAVKEGREVTCYYSLDHIIIQSQGALSCVPIGILYVTSLI